MRRFYLTLLFITAGAAGNHAVADAKMPDIDLLFQPYSTDRVTISPDGRHVAYSLRQQESLRLVIVDLERPEAPVRIHVADDQVRPLAGDSHKTAVRMTFMRWAKPGRLVFAADILHFRQNRVYEGTVFAIDADGKNARVLAQPNDVAFQPPIPIVTGAAAVSDARQPILALPDPQIRSVRVLGLPPEQPDFVIVGGTGPGLGRFKINIETGKWSPLEETKWRDQSLAGAKPFLFDMLGEPRVVRFAERDAEEFMYIPPTNMALRVRSLDKYLAAGSALNFNVTPDNYLGERSIPLGFDYDPNILYYASNVGRRSYGVFALDLAKKQPTPFAVATDEIDLAALNEPFREDDLVFDRHRQKLVGVRYVAVERGTHWLDPEIDSLQKAFDRKFPDDTVEILEWDAARSRFVILVSNGGDPGRYYVSMLNQGKLMEFAQRAPWIDPAQSNPTAPISFSTTDGVNLTAYYTQPRKMRATPPPLVVWLHDGPWQRDQPGFDRLSQVVANMGFAVLRVNYRGSSGFGRVHRDAIREAIDRVPLDDVRTVLAWLGRTKAFDPKRVALLGEGFGGYLAVRGLELFPHEFRCAVAIDGRFDLAQWINDVESSGLGDSGSGGFDQSSNEEDEESAAPTQIAGSSTAALEAAILRHFLGSDRAKLHELSPARNPERVQRPVMFVQSTTSDQVSTGPAKTIAASLRKREIPTETLVIGSDYERGVPGARARVFSQIEGFLNATLYDYKVDLGEVEKVGDAESDRPRLPAMVDPIELPKPQIPLPSPPRKP